MFFRFFEVVSFVPVAHTTVIDKQLVRLDIGFHSPILQGNSWYFVDIFFASPVPSIAALPELPARFAFEQLMHFVRVFTKKGEAFLDALGILDASVDVMPK